MRTIVSAAVSLDGYIDDCSPSRLRLSSPEDWACVAAMRSRCDAILVGAGTVRADNPSLVIKDPALREARLRAGMEPDICKVTITRCGNIDPGCGFFTRGRGRKIVFTTPQAPAGQVELLKRVAEVYMEKEITPEVISERLTATGCRTLFVEGGTSVLGMYLGAGHADFFRLAVAPFMVGDSDAPRLLPPGGYPWSPDSRLVVRSTEDLGGTAVLEMVPPETDRLDRQYLAAAVAEGRKSTPCGTAYRVGAVVVTASGEVFTGFTHETGLLNHAEEEAVAKAEAAGADLRGAAVYSSMEPCTHRKSKPLSCTALIIERGFVKAVYALPEPTALARCEGHLRLANAGLEVCRIADFDAEVVAVNSHILGRG
ncbi:MAG: dihydrofolate reductase family protein [Rikenellaceae bacterium]|nr:dihydrofolate reductase family protein [Rikenellaceae bacterium]